MKQVHGKKVIIMHKEENHEQQLPEKKLQKNTYPGET